MNIMNELRKRIIEKLNINEIDLEELIGQQISELSGLIDEEGALVLIAKKEGFKINGCFLKAAGI